MGDTPMAEESEAPGTAGCAASGGKQAECHREHVSFLMGKYPYMGMDAIVHRLDSLDNAKDGLEEDIAGILDDQSAAERDMAELRADQARYRENLELALQKQQRVVDSLLHLVEDMSGLLKRLEEVQPLASGPERVVEPWLPAPEDGRPGEGQRLTPDAPHNGGRPTPPGDSPPTTPAARSPHRSCRPRGQCWAPTPTHPRPQHVGGVPQQPAQWAGSRGRDSG